MARSTSGAYCPAWRVPHACGDGPRNSTNSTPATMSSPRLWGWPVGQAVTRLVAREFPTPVGMARNSCPVCCSSARVPHACGDGPSLTTGSFRRAGSSPRLWGWPVQGAPAVADGVEFPTPVGMARVCHCGKYRTRGVPHACGDGPCGTCQRQEARGSSPRLWGWPEWRVAAKRRGFEFPTPVGMARRSGRGGHPCVRVPHACGDGPPRSGSARRTVASSPRLWGWPVGQNVTPGRMLEFPTPVGMARRQPRFTSRGTWSSPRLWGWPARASGVLTAVSRGVEGVM